VKFDWTINVGTLISALLFLTTSVIAWTNLRWRVTNLETGEVANREKWKEHMLDSDSRDQIISRIDKLLQKVETIIEERSGGRRTYMRTEHPEPYLGEERRGRKS